jgi:hypothetical protein
VGCALERAQSISHPLLYSGVVERRSIGGIRHFIIESLQQRDECVPQRFKV